MPDYAISNELAGTKQAIATTYKTLINLSVSSSVALRRPRIGDVFMGVEGTPSDQAMVWDISRTTGVGTATAATPVVTISPAAKLTVRWGTHSLQTRSAASGR